MQVSFQIRKPHTVASPGPRGGASILESAGASLPHQGGQVYGNIALGSFYDNFKPETGPANEDIVKGYQDKIATMAEAL